TATYQEALETALELVEKEDWEAARDQLELLIEGAGYIPGKENAHGLLAYTYQQLEETEKERLTWATITEQDAHNLDAVIRLLTIAYESEDWPELKRWSDAWLAINPLAETPWRGLLKAEEEMNNSKDAIAAGEVLIQLDPPDIAAVHYRVAEQMVRTNKPGAHRHVLMALEEAPRYRDAYKLLYRIKQPPQEDPFLFGFKVPPVHE
ncbi:MAG: hypothetical protein O7C75_07570, partial [Verrucomicrobia bacterium]|nr:hypothetical protein [Verrucomicrobiota bacterium]